MRQSRQASLRGPSMVLAASRASCTKFSIPRRAIQTLLLASSSFLHLCRLGVMSAGASTMAPGRRSAAFTRVRIFPWCSSASTKPSRRPLTTRSARGFAQLREENVLILSSGNLMHNLHAYAWRRHVQQPCDWPFSFEKRVRELLLAGDHKPLIGYEAQLGREAELAVPTPDHYLPLLSHASGRIFVFFLNRRDKMVRVPRRPRDSVAIEHRLHKLQRRTQ